MADDKDKIIADLMAQVKKQNDIISKIATGLDGSDQKIDLSSLTSSVDRYFSKMPGGALAKATFETGKAAYTTLKAINDRSLAEANDIFKMYRSGVAISSDEMLATADAFHVSFDQLADLFVKHSQVVANVGIPKLAQFSKDLSNASRHGAIYAMNQDQLNEESLKYMEIISLSGKAQNYSTQQLVANFDDFTKTVIHASQVTGMSTDQITNNIKARMSEPSTQYLLNSMNAEEAHQLEVTMAALQGFSSETNKIGDLMADQAVLWKRGADSSAYLSQGFRDLLTNTGTLEKWGAALAETDPEKQAMLLNDWAKSVLESDYAKSGIFTGEATVLIGQLSERVRKMSDTLEQTTKPLDKFATDMVDLNEQVGTTMTTAENTMTQAASSAMAVAMPKLQQFSETLVAIKDDDLIPFSNELWRVASTAKSVSDVFIQLYNDLNKQLGNMLPELPDWMTGKVTAVGPGTMPPGRLPAAPTPSAESPTAAPTQPEPTGNTPIKYIEPTEPATTKPEPAVLTTPPVTTATTTPYIVDIKYEPVQPITATIPNIDAFIDNVSTNNNNSDTNTQLMQTNLTGIIDSLNDFTAQRNNELIPYVTSMISQLTKLIDKIDHQTITLKNSINNNSGIIT